MIFCRDFSEDRPTITREFPISGVNFIRIMCCACATILTIYLSKSKLQNTFKQHLNHYEMIVVRASPKVTEYRQKQALLLLG